MSAVDKPRERVARYTELSGSLGNAPPHVIEASAYMLSRVWRVQHWHCLGSAVTSLRQAVDVCAEGDQALLQAFITSVDLADVVDGAFASGGEGRDD